MKLHRDNTEGHYSFTGYGEDYVAINGKNHQGNLVLLPRRLILDWTDASFEALTQADFDFLAELKMEIMILGTGAKQRFPHPQLLQGLMRAGVGLEVMNTQAACRTYNILVAEGRNVGCALLQG
ncbi:MAG TPA: Mth938-like domain-containing protein [Azospira sp.]|nr:Mth938-like domain-containing protein [Azospira sp.]